MRVFALSDIHVDYDENLSWIKSLSQQDYQNDILILAGDVSDRIELLAQTFGQLKGRFKEVMYLPGNHELWVRHDDVKHSIEKFEIVIQIAIDFGMRTVPYRWGHLSIVPLFGWYDGSFGQLPEELSKNWSDYSACSWPWGDDDVLTMQHFSDMNKKALEIRNSVIISFSHFVPRIDLMPRFIPSAKRWIYPVLGSVVLEKHIRKLQSNIHVYGHSHVNQRLLLDNTLYINNAYGYPGETRIAAKKLITIFESY